MKEKERPTFPENFFSTPRPTVSLEETLKDVTPIEWSTEVLNGKKKAEVYSVKEMGKGLLHN